ncbi:hypothetical protein B4135_2097 [Caldibacillus debilis]|uniref:Uncharacterized protein n=1 Tax=Caldibacillus debilis TaxID=301148 RepID=A0A150M4R5_9BACI|nr:hypothetical protein B4135_2097 [Caldibacillus debilis]
MILKDELHRHAPYSSFLLIISSGSADFKDSISGMPGPAGGRHIALSAIFPG